MPAIFLKQSFIPAIVYTSSISIIITTNQRSLLKSMTLINRMLDNIRRIVSFIALLTVSLSATAIDREVPDDYDSIQEAINQSDAGDTIVIAPGKYQENLTLSTDLTLRGEETARTIIEPDDSNTPAMTINNTNATVQNLTFINSPIAIEVNGVGAITMSNNVFDIGNDGIGILLINDESNLDIINNTFYDNEVAISGNLGFSQVENNIFSKNHLVISPTNNGNNVSHNCYFENDDDGNTGNNSVRNEDPLFVHTSGNVGDRDFHLRDGSDCIDAGQGFDKIEAESVADAGAYGGEQQDDIPYPVQGVSVFAALQDDNSYTGTLTWAVNNAYRVSNNNGDAGGYFLYYAIDANSDDKNDLNGTQAKSDNGTVLVSPINVKDVKTFTLAGLQADTSDLPAPEILSITTRNQTIEISWSAVDKANSYQLHYGIDSTDEKQLSIEDQTSATITDLQNSQSYLFAVTALRQSQLFVAITAYNKTDDSSQDEPNHDQESALSSVQNVKLGDPQMSLKSAEKSFIVEPIVAYPTLPNEGCFIATAAFGYYSAPQVHTLRDLRDRYLLTTDLGTSIVQWYYQHSPPVANYIRSHATAKIVTRLALYPLIQFATLITTDNFYQQLAALFQLSILFICGLLGWQLWSRTRRLTIHVIHHHFIKSRLP